MPTPTPSTIGSLLDLLPRPNTPEWLALPPHVREEAKLLRKGYRPISQGDMDEYNLVPKRVEMLQAEVSALTSKISDVHTGQSELGDKLIPLVETILTEQRAMRAEMAALGSEVTALKNDRDKHAKRIDGHDTKLAEHAEHITGIHKRLELVVQTISKRPKRKPRKKAK